ncbi:MAG: hypothetical protein Q8R02_05225 [Hyphomonadaceae bacterium]|nr:hypothetical protein [Hyphomonadaceae bacterium]
MSRDTKAESAAVRKILHSDWDPIGCGVPEDEYDSYVWPVYALLIRGAPREEVAAYLQWAADVNIKLPVPEEKLTAVVDKLMALGFASKIPPT